jgi:hypothetical protein
LKCETEWIPAKLSAYLMDQETWIYYQIRNGVLYGIKRFGSFSCVFVKNDEVGAGWSAVKIDQLLFSQPTVSLVQCRTVVTCMNKCMNIRV